MSPVRHNPPENADETAARTPEEERESYRRGYEQDLLAAQRRLQELQDANLGDSPAAVEAAARIEGCKELLKQSGDGHKAATKRPAGRAKQTR